MNAAATESMKKVLVVDDDADQRGLLEDAVRAVPGLSLTPSAEVGREALRRAEGGEPAPDLVLLDVRLPDVDGLDVLRTLRSAWPTSAILVASVMDDERTVVEAIRRGARGYLLKDGSLEEIVHALHGVLDGHYAISPAVARHLVSQMKVEPRAAPEGEPLTARELEVLELISHGDTYKEVAAKLEVQLCTVEAHIKNLYRKLESHSKVQAIRTAKARGYLA
ncbi:MAG: hypothetical protein RL653_1162 [Pseudomonadota bacterium]